MEITIESSVTADDIASAILDWRTKIEDYGSILEAEPI